jgi:two-component system response regulator AtoC
MKINCAALTASLLEAELFGYERGAFTGAAQAKPGLIEAADGGTVFLDEVGELPLLLQAKLLRTLEDGALQRLGAVRPRPVDVRFVAATNRDLEAEVRAGAFRRDLYFRLAGVSITIPPLRERAAEIGELASVFVAQACHRSGLVVAPRLAPEALALLEQHPWPGNLRELRNVLERAVLLCDGVAITPADLPPEVARPLEARAPPSTGRPPPPGEDRAPTPAERPLRHAMEAMERQRIVDALERCGGNQTRAAELLGMPRRTLTKRLGQYDVPRPRAARACPGRR